MLRQALVSTGVALTLVHCKPPNTSKTKSLDNFAAGTRVSTNVCVGDPKLAADPALQSLLVEAKNRITWDTTQVSQKPAMATALTNAFAALPPITQTQFLASGGKFLITSRANNFCAASEKNSLTAAPANSALTVAALKEGLSQITACYMFLLPGEKQALLGLANGGSPSLVVILKDDPVEIAHNTVRAFGYINAELSPMLAVSGDFTSLTSANYLQAQANPTFVAARHQIAVAFLSDLKGTPSAQYFKQYTTASSANTPSRLLFETYVYAEAFDSFFCNQSDAGSKNTFRAMQKSFPKTFKAFTATLVAPKGTTTASASRSLNLTSDGVFGWIGDKYNGYTTARDNIINNLTQQVYDANGGTAPSTYQTLSVAANAAFRPAESVPLLSSVLSPAIKYTDSIAGATVNQNGDTSILSTSQRVGLATAATLEVGVSQAAPAIGMKFGAKGVAAAQDALIDSGAGRALTDVVTTNAPQVAQAVWQYGSPVVEKALSVSAATGVSYLGRTVSDQLPGVKGSADAMGIGQFPKTSSGAAGASTDNGSTTTDGSAAASGAGGSASGGLGSASAPSGSGVATVPSGSSGSSVASNDDDDASSSDSSSASSPSGSGAAADAGQSGTIPDASDNSDIPSADYGDD